MFEFIDASLSKVALANNGFRSSSRVLISTEFVHVIKPMSAVLPFAEVRIYDIPGVTVLTGRLPFVSGRTACSLFVAISIISHHHRQQGARALFCDMFEAWPSPLRFILAAGAVLCGVFGGGVFCRAQRESSRLFFAPHKCGSRPASAPPLRLALNA